MRISSTKARSSFICYELVESSQKFRGSISGSRWVFCETSLPPLQNVGQSQCGILVGNKVAESEVDQSAVNQSINSFIQ